MSSSVSIYNRLTGRPSERLALRHMVTADDVAGFSSFDVPQETANLHPLLDWIISKTPKSAFIPGASGLVKDWTLQDLKQIAATYRRHDCRSRCTNWPHD